VRPASALRDAGTRPAGHLTAEDKRPAWRGGLTDLAKNLEEKNRYIEELEKTLAAKNAHIERLERTVSKQESILSALPVRVAARLSRGARRKK
jgi:uncharacterized coiled-coil protein SlyX